MNMFEEKINIRASSSVCFCMVCVLGHPGYLTWLFRSYLDRYPGAKAGCSGHTSIAKLTPHLMKIVTAEQTPQGSMKRKYSSKFKRVLS